ncbi:MAG: alpha/beta hydrolase [Clostridia bacterium]|nr:alpha/beta hydrolase [Clostridia bacterium]
MSLSLELQKKFLNSEHTGEYVSFDIPVEVNAKGGSSTASRSMSLHYMDEGEGAPIILIHSIGQSMYTWRKLFPLLSENYRVIAFDLPGHGYSSRVDGFNYSIPVMADIIKRLMDALKLQSAHLVGFGFGALYALDVTRQFPKRVGKLILMSPGGLTSDIPSKLHMLDNAIFGRLVSLTYGVRTIESLLQSCFFDLTHLTPDVVSEYYKTLADPESRYAIYKTCRNFDDHETMSFLRKLDHEVVLMRGTEDKWRSAAYIDQFEACLKNVRRLDIRNTGHLLHEEKPQRLSDVFSSLLTTSL